MSKNEKHAHSSPQMTVEGLARYVTTASPSSRRVIIREEKYYDSVSQPPYYREIKKSVIRHLCDPDREDGGLLFAAERIPSDSEANEYEQQRRHNNVIGLKRLHACRHEFIRAESNYGKPPTVSHSSVAGVKVIASPVVAMSGTYRGGTRRGCLKLYLGKQKPLDKENAAYIGAALVSFLDESFPSDECLSRYVAIVDVFRSQTYFAPDATTQRIKNLQDACQDIARLWDSV